MDDNKLKLQYQVLSPWAEVDPIALKGIAPRLSDLSNKRIGLFSNFKIAAGPIMDTVETLLNQKFPSLQFSRFNFVHNLWVGETEDKERFEDWLKGVDAVVAA